MQQAPHVLRVVSALGVAPNDVTSVISGPHVKDSAHFQGRAVDLGAVGGRPVGFNAETWDFIVRAIQSGTLQKIGTIGALATNPQLRAFAQAHGVELFEDPGTGPHLHLQVP